MDLFDAATCKLGRRATGEPVLTLHGEAEGQALECFMTAVNQADARPGVVHVDLGDVTFFGSAAIQTLVVAQRSLAERGTVLRIDRASHIVRRVLEVTGVAEYLRLPDDPGNAADGNGVS
jgi:anti-anti-sigma factor